MLQDEVSEELLRCQMELQELEPRLRGVISHCWSKVRGDFAYWETARQLDEADTDVCFATTFFFFFQMSIDLVAAILP